MKRKVEIGKIYEVLFLLGDYRQVTPLSYNEVSKTYTCKIAEPVYDEDTEEGRFIECVAELTAHDILYVEGENE